MKITVIGVPSAWGAPESGVIDTPARLRAAGLLDWLAGAGLEVRDHGDVPVPAGWQPPVPLAANLTMDGQLPHLSELLAVQREVRKAAAGAIEAGELPLLIGGECGIAPGAVAAVAAATSGSPLANDPARLLVVWLDAHGDLNTAETSPSGLLCGMPLSVALGRGHPAALAVGADAPIPRPEDTWLIGARDLDAGELATLSELPIHHVTVEELRGLGAERLIERILPGAPILPPEARPQRPQPPKEDSRPQALAGGKATHDAEDRSRANVYLHIDVDCIDPSEAPAVTFPVAGGLGTAEVADLAGYLCASGRLAALTLASANLPADEGGRTRESLQRLLTSMADALALAE